MRPGDAGATPRIRRSSKAQAAASPTEELSGERYSARRAGRTAHVESAGRIAVLHVQGVLVMSLTHIEIDDQAVETAKRLGGHRTKTAAVADALRHYNARLLRASAYDRFCELAQDWDLEGAEAEHPRDKERPDR